MARFKNTSAVSQSFYLPSIHVKGDGRYWDQDGGAKTLQPNEILETEDPADIALLRRLARDRIVKVNGVPETRPGLLLEIK